MKAAALAVGALLTAAAVRAAEPIAFARYQTIIDRQPFGQPPPGFNPQQMASEVTKGGAAAAAAELTAEQQELQKVVGFSVLNLSGDDCWVGISVPSAGDPKVPNHYYLKVGDTRDGWFVKSADPIRKTAVVVKDETEIELTLGTPFNGGAGAKGASAKTARAAGPSAPSARSGLLTRRAAGGGAAAVPTSFAGRRARREAEEAARAAEVAAREAERAAREEEAKAREEEERAAREAERAEQRQQLMDIREELRKAREEKEKQRAAEAADETEAATDENDES